jgi:RNA polymerase sigma factor (sigma-70 family)
LNSIAEGTAALAARETTDVATPADRRALGSKAVLLELERSEGQALFGFALRLGLSEAEAQDAVQEALLRLWAQFTAGSTIENPRNWTFRTIYRIAMDEHRLRRRATGLLDRIGRATSRSSAHEPTGQVDVWPEVDRLSDRQRQVIYLRYQADLAFEEIGTVLGITASAARSHCTFALAALRKRLTKAEVSL